MEASKCLYALNLHQFTRPLEWTKSTFSLRKSHVEVLLESLEHRDAVIRFTNARRLFYVLQGQSRTTPRSKPKLTHSKMSRNICRDHLFGASIALDSGKL
jgi:hypothetical protein